MEPRLYVVCLQYTVPPLLRSSVILSVRSNLLEEKFMAVVMFT